MGLAGVNNVFFEKKNFFVEKKNSSFKPNESKSFGMYLDKSWYSIELKNKPEENLFHIINLDINLLHYYLLEPILGIGDPRYDNRIDFLAGFHGLESIEKKQFYAFNTDSLN